MRAIPGQREGVAWTISCEGIAPLETFRKDVREAAGKLPGNPPPENI